MLGCVLPWEQLKCSARNMAIDFGRHALLPAHFAGDSFDTTQALNKALAKSSHVQPWEHPQLDVLPILGSRSATATWRPISDENTLALLLALFPANLASAS